MARHGASRTRAEGGDPCIRWQTIGKKNCGCAAVMVKPDASTGPRISDVEKSLYSRVSDSIRRLKRKRSRDAMFKLRLDGYSRTTVLAETRQSSCINALQFDR